MDTSQQIAHAVRLHHAGRYEEAAALYRRILRIDANHTGALNGLGMIAFAAGRFDEAIGLLERVLRQAGEHPGLLMNLGAVHDGAGNDDAAAACYQRAISLSPRYPDPYYNLGALQLRLGRPDQAIAVFDRCMNAVGRDFHALAYKAHALIDAGRRDEADHLLDYQRYVRTYRFATPDGFRSLAAYNRALGKHIRRHPTLAANVMSTVGGKHTGELLEPPLGPMAAMEPRIREAVRWYLETLPNDPAHPMVRWRPRAWKITSWGVVMGSGGHERSHIHPKGWLSGVFYVQLPEVVSDPGAGHQGWLRFGEPTGDIAFRAAPTVQDHQPRYGQMFLFPSYFYHGTVPFESDQRRICVSFDVEPL
jgi:Tfp pilus assembly protein PilF